MTSHPAERFRRSYDGAMADLRARLSRAGDERLPPATSAGMQLLADVLWDHFGGDGDGRHVSWVGFYLPVHHGAGEPIELILGPRRDRPACSPIGLHGACGRAFLTHTTLVITDVAKLGAGYVACDPRDRAELVIPCLDEQGKCHAVLDFDSFEPGAFSGADVAPVIDLLRAAGLHSGRAGEITVI